MALVAKFKSKQNDYFFPFILPCCAKRNETAINIKINDAEDIKDSETTWEDFIGNAVKCQRKIAIQLLFSNVQNTIQGEKPHSEDYSDFCY